MANLLTLEIIAGYTRPVFSLKNNITCLIDTGADTPVWTQGVDRLNDAFQIEHKKEEYYVKPIYSSVDDSYVDRVYYFAND